MVVVSDAKGIKLVLCYIKNVDRSVLHSRDIMINGKKYLQQTNRVGLKRDHVARIGGILLYESFKVVLAESGEMQVECMNSNAIECENDGICPNVGRG